MAYMLQGGPGGGGETEEIEPVLVRMYQVEQVITDVETQETTRKKVYAFDHLPEEGFLGRIESAGPLGEGNYSDARYWVREVQDASASETDPLSLSYKTGGRWVTAHNLTEYGVGASDRGVHGIAKTVTGKSVPPRWVWVERRNLGGQLRWVFWDYPGQMIEAQYAYLATSVDAEGCVDAGSWYKTTGPAITSKTAPP